MVWVSGDFIASVAVMRASQPDDVTLGGLGVIGAPEGREVPLSGSCSTPAQLPQTPQEEEVVGEWVQRLRGSAHGVQPSCTLWVG